MKAKQHSITIVGPGRGHNISLLLNNFSYNKSRIINYFGVFLLDAESFFVINFYNYKHRNKILQWFKRLYLSIIIPKAKVLYIQDGIVPYDYKLLKTFKKFEKMVFNVWSEYNIPDSNSKGSEFKKRIMKDADIIQCNWHGTADRIKMLYPEYTNKTVVLPWGFPKAFFAGIKVEELHGFTRDFTEKIKKYRYSFLNMRSIADYNAIEELLDAAVVLKESNNEVFEDCLFVFWPGNNVSEKIKDDILIYIERHNLQNNVWYVEHPFLPNQDIKYIISSFDFIVNLVKHDQLSTSVTEAMFLEKELLCADIKAYKYLNDIYDLRLRLIELTPTAIATYITDKITDSNAKTPIEILQKRKNFVATTLNAEIFISGFEKLVQNLISE